MSRAKSLRLILASARAYTVGPGRWAPLRSSLQWERVGRVSVESIEEETVGLRLWVFAGRKTERHAVKRDAPGVLRRATCAGRGA